MRERAREKCERERERETEARVENGEIADERMLSQSQSRCSSGKGRYEGG